MQILFLPNLQGLMTALNMKASKAFRIR